MMMKRVCSIRSDRECEEKRRKAKVCFISFVSVPVLSPQQTGFVGDAEWHPELTGGAELQQGLLAEELQMKGYEVSFIVPDIGQKPCEVINRIKFLKLLPSGFTERSMPLSRKLYFYLIAPYLIWNRLKLANSDIYFEKMIGESSALVALFTRLKKKRYIYWVSHEKEVDGIGIKEKNFLFAQLIKFAIRKADNIIVQSKYQQKLLKRNFNKDGILIKSICVLPNNIPKKEEPPIILWGARMTRWKRPELFLKLAKAIPTGKFLMLGGPASLPEDQQYFKEIKELAAHIPNITLTGFIPHHQIDQYFNGASIFVSTSRLEGFPNTFLQAWARHVPVVSLNFDPGEIICNYKLGFRSNTFEEMVKDVKQLINDEALRQEMGRNSRKYVEDEHDIKKVAKQYMELFEKLLEGK